MSLHCKQNLLGDGGLLLAAAAGALLALSLALGATALLGRTASLASLAKQKENNTTTIKILYQKNTWKLPACTFKHPRVRENTWKTPALAFKHPRIRENTWKSPARTFKHPSVRENT